MSEKETRIVVITFSIIYVLLVIVSIVKFYMGVGVAELPASNVPGVMIIWPPFIVWYILSGGFKTIKKIDHSFCKECGHKLIKG
jgi:hypothetical protein